VLFLHVAVSFHLLLYMVTGQVDKIERARIDLNSKELFDGDAERLYVYSVVDELVAWKDVEDHGEDAERKGWVVRREKYESSGHAGHIMKDEKRYWGAVQKLWSTM